MLGTNRDYKSRDKAIWSRLKAHKARMDELIAQGVDPKEASAIAFEEVTGKSRQIAGKISGKED